MASVEEDPFYQTLGSGLPGVTVLRMNSKIYAVEIEENGAW